MRIALPLCLASIAFACQSVKNHTFKTSKSEITPKAVKQDEEINYSKSFRNLPLAASLSQLPWTSDSWTSLRGGASFRWQPALAEELDDLEDLSPFIHYPLGKSLNLNELSPIEKLDLFVGNKNWELTRKERARTLEQKNSDGSPRSEIPEWEGIMHAWSEASLQFEPISDVTVQSPSGQNIPFAAQDIYSLLSLFVHEQAPRPIVLASACPQADLGSSAAPYGFENEKQALRRKTCGAIDAASFHITLANQIGKKNEGFIMDRDRDGEISNNPVVAYESRIIENSESLAQTKGPKKIHLRTVVFLTAETELTSLDADDEAYPYETEAFEYELSLNEKGEIIEGKWLTETGRDANTVLPDFLWKAKPVWLNGAIKTVYEKARQTFAEQKQRKQLRPLEDMSIPDRQALNQYFNDRGTETF